MHTDDCHYVVSGGASTHQQLVFMHYIIKLIYASECSSLFAYYMTHCTLNRSAVYTQWRDATLVGNIPI
jgi:hypothetical protein